MRLEAHRNVLSLPFGYLGTELRGQCEGKRKPNKNTFIKYLLLLFLASPDY